MTDPAMHKASAALRDLETGLEGTVTTPESPGYDEARHVWNGIFDPRPAAIAHCRGAADVMHAVRWARASGWPLAVRGGGHSVAGHASVDDGLVIDLSPMRGVQVDPDARVARAEGGATIADLDRETQAVGLAVPMGVVSATGIAGLTLGGGMGWLRRAYGLACDALTGATVVTADGRLVRADEEHDRDLLWALRGGGGNFGIVTSFEFRAHPVGPQVAFNATFYPLHEARRVFAAHDDYLRDGPEEVSTLVALGRLPHEEVPEGVRGRPFVAVVALHTGEAAAGFEEMAPLREIAEPLLDLSDVIPYLEAQRFFEEDYPEGDRYYWKSASLEALPGDAIDDLVAHAERAPSDRSTIDVWVQGGAVERPGPEDTAFGRRDLRYLVNGEAHWEAGEDDEANIAWVRACLDDLAPYRSRHPYVNFAGFLEEGEALTRDVYEGTHERLARLKQRYDPDNLFRRNANVRPSGEGG